MHTRSSLFVLFAAALLGAGLLTAPVQLTAGGAKADASDRAQVVKFLRDYVIGKTLATPTIKSILDDNKMEAETSERVVFNNLTETAEGFSFDAVNVMTDTRHDLDKVGKRLEPSRDYSGTSVARFEMCERTSTKKLTGTQRIVSTSIKRPSPEGTMVLITGMKVANGKLTWNETLPGYADFTAAKGKYRACSWDGKATFARIDGKLQFESEETWFDVDPDTLKRTPSKDKVASFLAKEIAGK